MSHTNIFSVVIGTSPAKIRGNHKRLRMMLQNDSGATMYISKSATAETAQAIVLYNGLVYETESTDELYVWASAADKRLRVEEVVAS